MVLLQSSYSDGILMLVHVVGLQNLNLFEKKSSSKEIFFVQDNQLHCFTEDFQL